MIDIIIPPAVVLLLCIAVHAGAILKRKEAGREHINPPVWQTAAGILLTAYCVVLSFFLLAPLRRNGIPAILKMEPFDTIRSMLEDCVRNGIFDLEALAAWTGSPSQFLGSVLTHSARNLGANLLLFIPIGVLLSVHIRQIRVWQAAAAALAVPVFIEAWQYLFTSGRTCDIDDVILNFAGIFIGCLAVKLFFLIRRTYGRRNTDRN